MVTSVGPHVQVSRPWTSAAEVEAATRVIERGYFGMGPETAAFEAELGDRFGRPTVCVNTGTSALQLALEALGLPAGSGVLVPTLTYVASLQAIVNARLRPILCDVRASDGLIDLEDAARRLDATTRVLMPVHYAGHCGDLTGLHAWARARELRVVEDAAHAFGTRFEAAADSDSAVPGVSVPVGAVGDLVCFSFDGIKNITAGEGGAVTGADIDALERVRCMRRLGIVAGAAGDFDVSGPGYRYHMPDLNAAIGRAQLARFDAEIRPRREAAAAQLRTRVGRIEGVELLASAPGVVAHILPIRLARGRDAVRATLAAAGLETTIHYKPNHLLSRFADGEPRPVAEALWESLLTLPLQHEVDAAVIDRTSAAIERALAS